MFFPIFLTAELNMTEKISLSVEMVLRGVGTVFLVLIILWAILSLFKFFSGTNASDEPQKEKKSEEVIQNTSIYSEPVQETITASASDDSLIAAICAAIEAYRADEGLSGLSYRVVSFKRKSGRKSWNGSNED